MISFWQQVGLILAGAALSLVVNWLLLMWFFHWKKREQQPIEAIEQLQKDVVSVRERLRYIEGRLNGKFWKQQEN